MVTGKLYYRTCLWVAQIRPSHIVVPFVYNVLPHTDFKAVYRMFQQKKCLEVHL